MKKLLLLGAMLILGAVSFGDSINEIEVGADGKGTGKGSLGLVARGSVVDIASKVVLEIIPTVNAGIDGTSLEFNFGDMLPGDSAVHTGKFTARVLNNKVPVSIGDKLTTEVVDNGRTSNELKNTTGDVVGKIKYEKAGSSGFIDTDKTYEGVITSQINLNQDDKTKGTFYDTGAYVKINVNALEITTPGQGGGAD